MKKLLTLLLLFPLFFIGCSSDDDNNEPSKDALTLTRWKQTVGNRTYTFQFTTNNYCNYIRQVEDFTPYSAEYKYRLEEDKVLIHRMMETTIIATGTLKDDILYITFDEKDLALEKVPYVNY